MLSIERDVQVAHPQTSMSKKHGINIPGAILDELKNKNYSDDARFQQKRTAKKQLSRKESRKRQRAEKKQKKNGKTNSAHSPKVIVQSEKVPKRKPNTDKIYRSAEKDGDGNGKLPFSSDDELSSGDFDEFDDGDLDEEEWGQLRELEEEHSEVDGDEQDEDSESEEEVEEESGEEPETAEDVFAALKAKKSAKKSESKQNLKSDKRKEEYYPLPPSERSAFERDEMDMQYYAKKLNLKSKNKRIHAKDEYDAIGGLLEGLDYFENVGNDDEEYGDFSIDEDKKKSKGNKGNGFPSDDEISFGDFDEFNKDDLNEEEWEQLRELEDDEDDEDKDGSDVSDVGTRVRENPYVAPQTEETSATYVPPNLRRKQLADDGKDSAIKAEIRKKVKSALNKLSDSNLANIILSLNVLYDEYPRQYVTDTINFQILEIVAQKNKLLDGFIMNYAAVSSALFRLRGLEVGASFIQRFVEKFLADYAKQQNVLNNLPEGEALNVPKECSNVITLLSYCYNFGYISSNLIYDLIREFVTTPNEATTELLLRIVSVSGQLIRGDDPSALKEILSQLLANVRDIKEQSPRLQFLLNNLSDLKNNRLKASVIATDYHPTKRIISGLYKDAASVEPLQVSLNDIRNVETKGKWWLVGASWRGNMDSALESRDDGNTLAVKKPTTKLRIEDDLLDDIPDWSQIAKEQRMNTDIRRAIFISIMSAQDFEDAFSKLEKLNLKNKQISEIPRVLLHCLLTDSEQNGYNPFYSLVAARICEEHRQLLKAFQFLFWDIVKKFENDRDSDDEDDFDTFQFKTEEKRLRDIAAQGRFFGYLITKGILKLDGFKHVPIMGGLNDDGVLFIEVLLYQMLLTMGKNCEQKVRKGGNGKKEFVFKSSPLKSVLIDSIKLENRVTILKGIKWFIKKKLNPTNYLVGEKGEKQYERDKRRVSWAIEKFIDTINEELDGMDHL
ncbi:Sgd1p KNAG_0B05640 [Huiozyma naganishii CBS 8797]|uniref:MI domain-containing protein n=1 Tax=Huiozyma naganishii (strain ATCC MYA-139 / BCRC 22969 / CBS 8797 / KCTC 17520 / NBRC 10181 / NCYC 3082 / Yp74L-3) TaxID=1071383 RepID=J7S588_HUIN7|nr:hypothetical protein KNAG_0B05640 [Kazachstania naganishii CBS 8797]CCK68996.1 hypothetical protein KNAG_0B05640 [Kazachstania naganishii CBS 8797]